MTDSMLETALRAARSAGKAVAEHYPTARKVTVKGYRDIVTEADLIAERIVIETIRAGFPDHTIISEETGTSSAGSPYRWVVDPLDGTVNYAHRFPVWAVSVGLVKDNTPVVGAIYDPLRRDMFSAERGRGAHLNGAPIHVSPVERLADALVGFDWGHADDVREQSIRHLSLVAPQCRTVRGLGSAALALAYVAAGWLDAYLNLDLKPWDTAAGLVLLAEAGGRVSTPTGAKYSYDCPTGLATNGTIHDEILAFLRTPA